MDPYTGRTYAIGDDLARDDVGQAVNMDLFRERVTALGSRATEDERRAAVEARALVRVAPPVAHTQRLGQREQDRRKRRRQATKAGRKHNR